MSDFRMQCTACGRSFTESGLLNHLQQARTGPCRELYVNVLHQAAASSPPPSPSPQPEGDQDAMDLDDDDEDMQFAAEALQMEDLDVEDSEVVINIDLPELNDLENDDDGLEEEELEPVDEDTMYF